jgi:sulfate permease, SulP family
LADATQPARPWPVLRSLAGWQRHDLAGDIAAGLTLVAIALPEQMATARLGGFQPGVGLFVFVAGSLAFALLGANRYLSSGADSTITPIFAGTLGLLAAQGSSDYVALAAALAIAAGAIVVLCGVARLGWIASFLSIPVTTGFLAGIAVHIAVSQLPVLLGLSAPPGDFGARVLWIAAHLRQIDTQSCLIGAGVFALSYASERLNWPVPGALVGLVLAMLFVAVHGAASTAVVSAAAASLPHVAWPAVAPGKWGDIAPLAFIIAMVVMVQTAATTRAFTSFDDPQDLNRDFIGVGAGSILAGVFGLFPVNASPPRTAAAEQAGGRSQLASLFAAAAVGLLALYGAPLLRYVPLAALAGVLLAIALRIARFGTMATVLRQSPAEFLLIVATVLAIVALPIQTGVAIGIGLSVLHGIWTITRTRVIGFEKVPGTSVWWPPGREVHGETLPHVRVVGFEAPLSFMNADEFRSGMIATIERDRPKLIVLEASGVAEIDFTAAQVLIEVIERCHEAEIKFAIARLTSPRAQHALERFGIAEKLGPHARYRSVDDALRALAG